MKDITFYRKLGNFYPSFLSKASGKDKQENRIRLFQNIIFFILIAFMSWML